jgi:uncharacterized membrane protein YgdD (TMEM256/DUF423 family)
LGSSIDCNYGRNGGSCTPNKTLTGLFSLHFSTFSFRWVTRLFIAGILLFSGSIYLIIICKYMQVEFPRLLVLLTPLGGVCLTAGWITLAITLQRAVTQKVEN